MLLPQLKRMLGLACGALAAVALFTIMVLTLIDVSSRKLFNASVPGSLELTELLMVAVIFAALPLVSLQGEHVVIDSLDSLLADRLRRLQGIAVELFCAFALAGAAWLMWGKAGQMAQAGDITAQLKIPLGPFVYLMSVLAAATAAVHLLLIAMPVPHHHPGVAEAP